MLHFELLRADDGLTFPKGYPLEDTLNRVFQYLDSSGLSRQLQSCLAQVPLTGHNLVMDDEELRGTHPKGKKHALIQMVNGWSTEHQLSFGEVKVAKKSNTITTIPELLDLVDCKL